MTEKLTAIERELRRAVEAQQYVEVQRLVLSFCQAAEAHARALPPADGRLEEIASMTLELLQWCRNMVQSARACAVLQLREIPKVQRYIPAPTALPAAWQIDV
jgi:hypothetical protein